MARVSQKGFVMAAITATTGIIDVQGIVDKLMTLENAPIDKLKATKTNVERRLAARLKAMQARKPKIDGNKVVVPKAEKPTYTKVEPKLKAVPRIEKGKITYKPRVAKPKDPGAVAAGKKAAKTAAKSGPKAA